MRFGMKHPAKRGRRASYGLDHALGFFVEVRDGERLVAEYDRLHPPYEDRGGAVRFLVAHGFFTEADLHEAAGRVGAETSDEMEEGAVRRAAEVLENMERLSGA